MFTEKEIEILDRIVDQVVNSTVIEIKEKCKGIEIYQVERAVLENVIKKLSLK